MKVDFLNQFLYLFISDKGHNADGAEYSKYGNEKHGHEDKYNKYGDDYSTFILFFEKWLTLI